MISYIYIAFFFIATIYAFQDDVCHGEESLRDCLKDSKFEGTTHFRSDIVYDVDLGREYNLRVIRYPVAFVHPINKIDVSKAIICGANHIFPVIARSGGHSFESYSIGDKNCTLVVDLINFNKISINKADKTAWAGFAFPSGSCPSVGAGGVILGGGEGLLIRKFGMSSDNLVDAQIVLADGTIVENANATKYADLFWALKGAGNAGYGIVTSLTLQIHEIPKTVTLMNFTYNFNPESIKLIYQTINELGRGFDKDLTIIIGFLHPGNVAFVRGIYLGPQNKLEEILGDFIEKSKPKEDKEWRYSEGDWFSSIYKNSRYPMNTEEGAKHPRTVSRSLKIKSFYVDNPGLSNKGVESLFDFMEAIKKEEGCGFYIETTLYGGGEVNEIPRNKTAFVHRGFMYDILTDVSLPLTGGEKCLNLLENFALEFRKYTSFESFQNIIDKELDFWQHRYYRENIEKLVEIKLKYDPHEVFRWSQSIPASFSSIEG
ncbi:FAD-binding domain-containing protein [Gigaspora margarita]|uniref:FAD-binding domain-containing protein n=1 Tax=Gigaspora margarita TaxID=4874 RepID=A0A8H3X9P2_GIGMA|nr:FAD-binding domain-containing protein [Gigaspora margarita]